MIREYDWSHHASPVVQHASTHAAHHANAFSMGHSLMSFDTHVFIFLFGIWAAFGICWWLIAEAATR